MQYLKFFFENSRKKTSLRQDLYLLELQITNVDIAKIFGCKLGAISNATRMLVTMEICDTRIYFHTVICS